MDRLYIVAPVFNERANVPALMDHCARAARRLAPRETHFVLVDDGSTDGTAEAIENATNALDVRVLQHDRNRGPGYAFGTAFEHLADRLQPDDRVATMEGDNTARVEVLLRMLERCEREGIDIVLASPHAYGGGFEGTAWWRRFLSAGASAFARCALGMHGIHTVSSFFRVHRGGALLALQETYGPRIIERPGFEGVVELVKKAMLLGLSLSEVPLRLDASSRAGKSKMRVLRTIAGYLALARHGRRWERMARERAEG